MVPSACSGLELWRDGALDALRAALLGQAPVFGPTYPRIITTSPGRIRPAPDPYT